LFVKWLSAAVDTSFRKVRFDTDTEKRLLTQLRPLDISEIRERTRARSYLPTVAQTAHEITSNARQPQCLPTTAQTTAPTAHKIISNSERLAKRRFTNWRFRKDSSDEIHLIDIEVGGGAYWVKEEDAHRKCKRRLLKFWERQGGREKAITKRGGAVTENTRFLIHQILEERSGGSEYLVEWVGYGSQDHSWEPKSGIPEDLIRTFRKAQLRQG
jgi:hypothetical protein